MLLEFRNCYANNLFVMIIKYWPESLQKYLRDTYQYDPVKGEVTRRVQPKRGPKSVGPVGSFNSGREMLLTIMFEGRAWAIRIAKLAVFLQTGVQYRFIEFSDGDRTNMKASNLVLKGEPVTPDDNEEKALEAIRAAAELRFKKRRLVSLEALIDLNNATPLVPLPIDISKDPTRGTVKPGEVIKTPQEHHEEAQLEKLKVRQELAKIPFVADYIALQKRYEDIVASQWYLRGMFSGITYEEYLVFEKACLQHTSQPLQEFIQENKDNADLALWEVHYMRYGHWHSLVLSGKMELSEFKATLLRVEDNEGNVLADKRKEPLEKTSMHFAHELKALMAAHNVSKEQAEEWDEQLS